MSIFPRHVVPGSSLTLHKRWLQLSFASDVKMASSEAHIRAPSGRSWWDAQAPWISFR